METLNKVKTFLKRYEASFGKQFKFVMAISLVAGLGVALEAYSWMQRKDPNVIYPRILLASHPLTENQTLTQVDLAMRSVPPPKPEGAVTDQDLHLVLGATLLKPLNAGELVTFDLLLLQNGDRAVGRRVPRGMRAYSFEPQNDLPVQIGDRVDILLVKKQGLDTSTLLAEGVQVLAVKAEEGRRQTILAAVFVDDLPVLEKAQQLGKLIITLRNPEEFAAKSKKTRRRASQLLEKTAPQVQIISEGQ